MLMVILLIEMEKTQFGAVIRDVWGEEFSSRESAGSDGAGRGGAKVKIHGAGAYMKLDEIKSPHFGFK